MAALGGLRGLQLQLLGRRRALLPLPRARREAGDSGAACRRCRVPPMCHAAIRSQRRMSGRVHSEGVTASPSGLRDAQEDLEDCELVLGKEVALGSGDDLFAAHLAEAVKNRNGAGVLLLTDVFGHEDPSTRDFTYRLACYGYSVLVPDLFRGNPFERNQPKSEQEKWRVQHPPDRVAADIAIAAKFIQDIVDDGPAPGEGRVAVLGFCFGGGRLIEFLARDDASSFKTGVMFYGTRFDPALGEKIRVPLLCILGTEDALCTEETVQELVKRLKDSKKMVFPGRGHAFAHHPTSMDDDDDAETAFLAARKWLHDHLLVGAPFEQEALQYKLAEA